jgi:peptide deformylase
MKEYEILRFGTPNLRMPSKEITNIDQQILNLLDRLKFTLHARPGRAAIAAPQIGKNIKLTVIEYGNGYEELINPVIVERVGEYVDYEGCLSLPGYSGRVKRAERITIHYIDRDGMERFVETKTRRDLARCYQHELDHFDGILYTDRLADEWLLDDFSDKKIPLAFFANSFSAPPLKVINL